MTYSFDCKLAEKYGVDEAIFLHNLYFWIVKNEANGQHHHEGRTWTYNSMAAFAKLFPFWSKRQVERIIRNLVANGALLEGNFNTLPYDRTKWYALGDEVTAHYQNVDMDFTERGNDISPNREMTYHETVTPIPDHTPDSKPDKKHIHAQFDCFWQAYPKKRAKEEARKAFFKLAPEEKLFGEIIAALEKQKRMKEWQRDNGRFIPYPASWIRGRRWEDMEESGTGGKNYDADWDV